MSGWNYRVMESRSTDPYGAVEVEYTIKEVYYGADGNPNGYGDASIASDTLDGLREQLLAMGNAILRPTLNEEELKGSAYKGPKLV